MYSLMANSLPPNSPHLLVSIVLNIFRNRTNIKVLILLVVLSKFSAANRIQFQDSTVVYLVLKFH